MTLTEFLLARIAEDESIATAAGHGCGYVFHEHNAGWVEVDFPTEHNARPVYEERFIRCNSPDRVLAECKAKRYIVESARLVAERNDGSLNSVASAVNTRLMLAAMADVYSDHPDYQQEW